MKLNSIGLSAEKSDALGKNLNILLASFQRYYQNLRGIHWNIKGKRFFDLHPHAKVPVGINVSRDEDAIRLIVDSL